MAEACDLCRAIALETVYRAGRLAARQSRVHLCKHCGLVQSLPRIDRAPRAPAAVSGGADWGNVRYGKGFRTAACMRMLRAARRFRSRPLTSSTSAPTAAPSRARHRQPMPKARQVTAVEPDERVANSVAGRRAHRPDRMRASKTRAFADGTFDIVHSCHTIEHLASPAAVLADHWRALKPGGLLSSMRPTSR